MKHPGYDGILVAAHHDGVQHSDSSVLHQSGGHSGQGSGEQRISEQIMGSLRPLAESAVPKKEPTYQYFHISLYSRIDKV